MDNRVKEALSKLLPIAGRITSGAVMALITAAALANMQATGGINDPALLAFLSSLFGDVVAGQLIDRLLSGNFDTDELEELGKRFDLYLQENNHIREQLAELLTKQDMTMGALGVALQHHERSVVERILRGFAHYQDLTTSAIPRFHEEYKNAISQLDPEIQYLTHLISLLEEREYIWKRYVSLPVHTNTQPNPSSPSVVKKWNLPSIFSILESRQEDDTEAFPEPKKVPLENINEVVEKYPCFALIGQPGAGKTTTLERLALDMAWKRLGGIANATLPVLLYLDRWDENQTLTNFIVTSIPQLPLNPIDLISSGQISLYADGLNQMGASGAKKVQAIKQWLTGRDRPKQFIVTCRASDYDNSLDLGMPIVLIEEMNEGHIRQFVQNYLEEDTATDIFLSKILPDKDDSPTEKSRQLFHLARNPFLLTSLIVIYSNSNGGDLPTNNGQLFQQLTQILWAREEQNRTSGWLPYPQMQETIGKLAFAMIEDNKPTSVSISYALRHVKDENLLKAGQSANLLEIYNGEVRFYHQLIQEYFAAVELLRIGIQRKVQPSPIIMPRVVYAGNVRINLDWRWEHVIVAASGISDNPETTFEYIKRCDPLLAAKCLASGISIVQEKRQQVVNSLISIMNNYHINEIRESAAYALESLIDSSAITGLTGILDENTDERTRRFATVLLGETRDVVAIPSLLKALRDESRWVRHASIEAIEKIIEANNSLGGLEAATFSRIEHIINHPEEYKYKHKKYVKGILEALYGIYRWEIIEDYDTEFEKAALKVLIALSGKVGIDALPFLLKVSRFPYFSQQAAINTIIQIGQEAIPYLVTAIHEDYNFNAAEALAVLGWKPSGFKEKVIFYMAWDEWEEVKALTSTNIPFLIEFLDSPHSRIRYHVANILGELGAVSAIPKLIELLSDEEAWDEYYIESRVSYIAREALLNIGTPQAKAAVKNWEKRKK